MDLASARELKAELLGELRLRETSQLHLDAACTRRLGPGIAFGICWRGAGHALAVRIQDPALLSTRIIDYIVVRSRGEVDIRFIGTVRPLMHSITPLSRRERVRPLAIGTSVGHVDVPVGSIGAFVFSGDVPCLLSNNHVLANENRAQLGDDVVQPAAVDGGREPEDVVARLSRFVPLQWNQLNYVDAAAAELAPGVEFDPATLRGLYGHADARLRGARRCGRGDLVFKIGRSTGLTRGRVTSCEVDDVRVHYESGTARFEQQIEITSVNRDPFAEGGDSGALVVDRDGAAIGLVFAADAGSPGLTYATPIGRVLSELDVTLMH